MGTSTKKDIIWVLDLFFVVTNSTNYATQAALVEVAMPA
jgi:hypothetical protein